MIRQLTTDDVPHAIAILERTGLTGAVPNFPRYLRWQPRCAWGAVENDRLVGLVSVLRQGPAGFVGAMAVEVECRRRGIGRELLEHAHAEARRAGIATLFLEATAMGEPLYRNLGYVDEHETVSLTREPTIAPPATAITSHDHAAVFALDRLATNLVRADMLAGLLAERGPSATVRVHGELAGFGLVVGDRLGPVIAREAAAGRALLDALAPACRVVTVPLANAAAVDALASRGFTEVRRLRRMRRGPAIAQHTAWIWALASPGAG